MNNNRKPRYAFICHTNYTLLNCINIVLNSGENFDADLYVEYMQDSMYQVIDRLKRTHLFTNIFEDSLCNIRFQKKHKLQHFFKKCLLYKNIRNKYYYLKHRFNIDREKINDIKYDAVFTSFLDYNSWHLVYISENAKLHFYEEGISTYVTGIIGCDENNPSLNILKRLLKLSVYDYNIESIYLNCPEAYKLNDCDTIKKISFINSGRNDRVLNDVFGGDYSIYDNKRIIILSQPLKEFYQLFDLIKNSLDNRNDCLIRLHQGDKEERFVGYKYINDDLLWELVSGKCVSDESVLIGYNSTALMTPKILHDKEPYIIFLFNLLDNSFGNTKSTSYKFYKLMCDLYKNKNKIFLPNSVSEYNEIILKII